MKTPTPKPLISTSKILSQSNPSSSSANPDLDEHDHKSALPSMSGGSPFEHRVARAISACTRCRSRKSKCDGKLPACSACEKAKVECIGFDAISKQNVSRSYIHDLENEVLALRKQLNLPLTGLPNATPSTSTRPSLPSIPSNLKIETGMHNDAEQETARALSALGGGGGGGDMSGSGSGSNTPVGAGVGAGYGDRRFSAYDGTGIGGGGGHENGRFNGGGRDGMNGDIDPSLIAPGLRSLGSFDGHPALTLSMADADTQSLNNRASAYSSMPSPTVFTPPISSSTHPSSSFFSDRTNGGPGAVGVSGSGVGLARMAVGAALRQHTATGSGSPSMSGGREFGLGLGSNGRGEFPTSHQRLPSITGMDRGDLPGSSTSNSHILKRPVSIPALPPPAAVDRLVQVYVDFVQIMLPILHMPTFAEALERVRERREDVTGADIFFVLMVLALSTMALSRSLDPTAELRMSSEAFYLEAVKHAENVFEDTNALTGLQAILLFCYYSLLNPTRGSIWFLVGLACRTAVDHGLHHETSQSSSLTTLQLDMNRRLFWAVYNLDRLLCQSLGRPPCIPDDFISVPSFSNLPDSAITDSGFLAAEPDPYKVVALNFLPLRELQSSIYSRLYAVRGTEPPTHEWFMNMFDRLKGWLQNSPEPTGTQSTEGYAVSFHNTVLLLFRPSPACPRPSQDALATCLSSSSYIIRIFKTLQRKNKINWYWLSGHYVFMAGITYLYGLWNVNLLGDSSAAPSMMEAHMDIQACLSVLEYLSVNVPSARMSRWTFEMLATAILGRLSGEQGFRDSASGSSSRGELLQADMPGIGSAGARAESAMRHSFQSQGLPSPLPKLELPNELSLLDNLFLNPLIPHPKASDSTTVGHDFHNTPRPVDPEADRDYPASPRRPTSSRSYQNGDVTTPRDRDGESHQGILAGSPAVPNMGSGGYPIGPDGEFATGGFDFLSFLAADDGGQGANAVWEQTEPFRQEMSTMG